MIRTFTGYLFLSGMLLSPYLALAHGGVDDGHTDEAATVGNPENRMIVLAIVGIVFLALFGFMFWSKQKNAKLAEEPKKEEGNPSA
jgi:LPXTG-motif cell wall-anchored protein